jgi:hypothetical protein
VAALVDCWCDKPSPGGLTKEPCTRKATQEDMLCDPCRAGCSQASVGPAGAVTSESMTVLARHAEVSFKVGGY